MREEETNVRIAQRMGKRLQMSNENLEVINAMAQMRREKAEKRFADELETAASKERYYT